MLQETTHRNFTGAVFFPLRSEQPPAVDQPSGPKPPSICPVGPDTGALLGGSAAAENGGSSKRKEGKAGRRRKGAAM